MLSQIEGGIVVSCQALEHEPLHGSHIMGCMAKAAEEGGATGIRANTPEDIQAIKAKVSLPVVGIIKRDYDNSQVYITPTRKEVVELMAAQPEMIAIDATETERPNGETLGSLIDFIRTEYPKVEIMADIATLEQAIAAENLGVDCISSTLHGYTEETAGKKNPDNNFEFIRRLLAEVNTPVIAEGNIENPEQAAQCLRFGCHAVVVGGAITRPTSITARFVNAVQ